MPTFRWYPVGSGQSRVDIKGQSTEGPYSFMPGCLCNRPVRFVAFKYTPEGIALLYGGGSQDRAKAVARKEGGIWQLVHQLTSAPNS